MMITIPAKEIHALHALFLSVPGSFDESLGNLSEDPLRTVLIAAGAVFLIVIVARVFWKQLKKLWVKAKQGGVILSRPKEYLTHAFLPSQAARHPVVQRRQG